MESQPHTKKRHRVSEDGESSEILYKTVKRPKLVEEYFDSANKIDVHNHLRQGSLALEEAWGGQLEMASPCLCKHFGNGGGGCLPIVFSPSFRW